MFHNFAQNQYGCNYKLLLVINLRRIVSNRIPSIYHLRCIMSIKKIPTARQSLNRHLMIYSLLYKSQIDIDSYKLFLKKVHIWIWKSNNF